MGYIEDNLLAGEQVVFRTRLHWAIFLGPLLWILFGVLLLSGDGGGTLSLILIVIGALSGLATLINFNTSEFGVTEKRVIGKTGWLRRVSLETLLNRVEGVSVEQGLVGRMLGYGTIVVQGTGGGKTPFTNVAMPFELRQAINQQIELQAGRP